VVYVYFERFQEWMSGAKEKPAEQVTA